MLKRKDALIEWEKEFGNIEKTSDFSGRRIARGAYNNEHSKFGWTIACILPQSEGGDYMTHNMICCNLETFRDKGEHFPVFAANGRSYIIKVVNNSYKILINSARTMGAVSKEQCKDTDFRKGEEGIECWKDCGTFQNTFFAGYVKINVETENFAKLILGRVKDFSEKVFDMPVADVKKHSDKRWEITFIDYNMSKKEKVKYMLDKCTILNSYTSLYIKDHADCSINIYYGIKEYHTDGSSSQDDVKHRILSEETDYKESFALDELVVKNTDAGKRKQLGEISNGFYGYNLCYKALRTELINMD